MSEIESKILLLPDDVFKYIKFDAESIEDKYPQKGTLFDKQYEGVAYLWNLLETKKIALLADEVGTGKTYQALGVLITMLKIKPDARCLIIAPRYQVAMNWIREYYNFVSKHYKSLDDQIKSSITHFAIPTIQYCHNLDEVVKKSDYGQIFVAKTTMFSNLKLGNIDDNEIGAKLAFEAGEQYRESIKQKYDLLIIDEAHYYRNFDGYSLRVNAAKGFFGTFNGKNKGIASKVLLITATPNYSRETDIKNIFKYFQYLGVEPEKYNDYTKILKEYALRRLRRLENKIKYQYREEKVIEASFEENLKAEMFFAVYQKHLARKILEKENNNGKKYNISENRLTFGYLEGCEIINVDKNNSNKSQKTESSDSGQDFNYGLDYEILRKIVDKYVSCFNKPPSHPKYDKIIDNIIHKERSSIFEGQQSDKNIIFVRRIPSVGELTERLLKEYDQILFEKLCYMLNIPKLSKQFIIPKTRGELDDFLTKYFQEEKKEEDDLVDSEDNQKDSFKNCVILDYFVRKKEKQSSTLGSKFRNLLLYSNSPFSMLFELPPDKDEPDEPYKFNELFVNKDKIDYSESAKNIRYIKYNLLKYTSKYQNKKYKKEEYNTIWTLFFQYEKDNVKLIKETFKFSEYEWEGLGNFTKKALVFASDAILELFCWYLLSNKSYSDFINIIKKNLQNSRTYFLLKESIEHFRYIWQKVLGLKEEELPDKDFNIFESSVPVYGFHGATKSDAIIKLFNTPFFPNNIIATSVLQEGVNLHYYCNNVIHYGIAWTHGADEQRNGRVDRFLGKVHRKLLKEQMDQPYSSAMNIIYPFLKDSIDELQVSQFIKFKRLAESIIDAGKVPKELNDISNKFETHWKDEYLWKPNKENNVEDPYSAKFEQKKIDKKILENFKTSEKRISGKNIVKNILTYLKKHQNSNKSIVSVVELWSENNPISKLFYLKAKMPFGDVNRQQPALISCGYLPMPLITNYKKENFNFYLKIISPVSKKSDFSKEKFKNEYKKIKKLLINYPLVKIEIDEDKTNYEYLICCSCVLVTFNRDGDVFLDENELKYTIEQTLYAADELEKVIYKEEDNADFELSIEQKSSHIKNENNQLDIRLGNKKHDFISEKWKEFKINDLNYVFLYKEFDLSKNDSFDIVKTLSKYPFINYRINEDKIRIQLNYLKDNFQKEEQEILEKWFEMATNYIEEEIKINN